MAVIIEAMMAGESMMERLTSTSSMNSRNSSSPETNRISLRSSSEPESHRLDGWQLIVYNDNVQAVEYCSVNWHTPDSVVANGADHLLPLAQMAWSLSLAMRDRGVIIRIMQHSRGRCARRIRDVDRRTRNSHYGRARVSAEVMGAIEHGIDEAIRMQNTGRDALLTRLQEGSLWRVACTLVRP